MLFRSLARNEALEYLQHINPDVQPMGQVEMPGFRMDWTSQPVFAPVKSVTDLGTPAGYTVSLNQLDVVLRKKGADNKDWVKFKLTLAGYTQTGSTSNFFGGSTSR